MGRLATFSHQSRAAFTDHSASESSFPDRVAQLLDRIDYRLADSDEQREAIFRLRYRAYLRDGGISPNPCETFSDPYDETGDVYLFGLYIDDELASSIRIHVASKDHPDFPGLEVFRDFLQPELEAGKVLIDSTRFVTDENQARLHRALPYATLRLSVMAAGYFGADHLLATVRAEHQAFYRPEIPLSGGLRTTTLPAVGKTNMPDDGPLSDLRGPRASATSVFPFNFLRAAHAVRAFPIPVSFNPRARPVGPERSTLR